jgi:hypothetical protein
MLDDFKHINCSSLHESSLEVPHCCSCDTFVTAEKCVHGSETNENLRVDEQVHDVSSNVVNSFWINWLFSEWNLTKKKINRMSNINEQSISTQ